MIITRLTPADIKTMRMCLNLYGSVFDEAETYIHNQPSDAYLKALLSRDTFITLVARDDDAVIGGLSAYVLPKFEQARNEIYAYDLAVKESHRRQGVATALLNALKAEARGLGAYVIFIQADKGDDPAIKLYEGLGQREDIHHFDILP